MMFVISNILVFFISYTFIEVVSSCKCLNGGTCTDTTEGQENCKCTKYYHGVVCDKYCSTYKIFFSESNTRRELHIVFLENNLPVLLNDTSERIIEVVFLKENLDGSILKNILSSNVRTHDEFIDIYDVNECIEGNQQCDGTHRVCVNNYGSFKCACADGYKEDDGVCKDDSMWVRTETQAWLIALGTILFLLMLMIIVIYRKNHIKRKKAKKLAARKKAEKAEHRKSKRKHVSSPEEQYNPLTGSIYTLPVDAYENNRNNRDFTGYSMEEIRRITYLSDKKKNKSLSSKITDTDTNIYDNADDGYFSRNSNLPEKAYSSRSGYLPEKAYSSRSGYLPEHGYPPETGYLPETGYFPRSSYLPETGYSNLEQVPSNSFGNFEPMPYTGYSRFEQRQSVNDGDFEPMTYTSLDPPLPDFLDQFADEPLDVDYDIVFEPNDDQFDVYANRYIPY